MTSLYAWKWPLFGLLVLVLIAVDLLAHRGDHASSKKSAFAWTAVWISVALAFGVGVWRFMGPERGEEYFAAYLIEKSLSVDNLFVFLVIFEHLRIPKADERRVLTWGILGALVTRGAFIAIGAALLQRWHWLVYVLGGLLVVTGVKLFREREDRESESKLLAWLERKLPLTNGLRGHAFFVREGGRLLVTPMLLALVVIELTDVAFAIDSVPAAFAVSSDPFVIYSSNVFAILGLRSLYIVLSHSLSKTRELEVALAAILVFAGAKMLASNALHVPALASVAVIIGILATAGVVTLARARRARAAKTARTRERQPA